MKFFKRNLKKNIINKKKYTKETYIHTQNHIINN